MVSFSCRPFGRTAHNHTKGIAAMARKNRVKTKNDAYYHVVSRIAHQALLMDDAVKRRMLDILYAAAAFCGVVVGTYMLMDNHFHILVYVPADAGARSTTTATNTTARSRRMAVTSTRRSSPASAYGPTGAARTDASRATRRTVPPATGSTSTPLRTSPRPRCSAGTTATSSFPSSRRPPRM